MPQEKTEKTDKDETALSPEEAAAIQLAQGVYGSILDAALPQDIMEAIGKSIQTEVPWTKLPAKQRLGLFRVAGMLQGRLPKVALPSAPAPAAKESAATTDDMTSEE